MYPKVSRPVLQNRSVFAASILVLILQQKVVSIGTDNLPTFHLDKQQASGDVSLLGTNICMIVDAMTPAKTDIPELCHWKPKPSYPVLIATRRRSLSCSLESYSGSSS